ncbi:MAG: S-adenosylmethionine:tRNA ribosyltransferase-isomerase [Planctomycetota bacterium]
MKVSDFDFELPEECIAQVAAEPRDSARMMVWRRQAGELVHDHISSLPTQLAAGDLLVLNDTKVVPARLYARRSSGGAVELLFLEAAPEHGERAWRALVKPAKKLKPGEVLRVGAAATKVTAGLARSGPEPSVLGSPDSGELQAEIRMLTRDLDKEGAGGWIVELHEVGAQERTPLELLESLGEMPLPPYIRRTHDMPVVADRERYQTVYANKEGAIAAPTAGLHFTRPLLEQLEQVGVQTAAVTLHVGLGTFRPVTAEDTRDHQMHSERYVLSEDTVAAIEACRARAGRVIAVGTTSVRVLESCVDESGRLSAGSGSTRLFIEPGYRFGAVDGLLTNFHLPRSTLLMLVGALTGREPLMDLYREAIDSGYRFYSYGDAMLVL